MPKKNGIPDRYGDYRGMGRPIPGTRFIAFKVPLKEDLASKADQYCDILTPRMVMDHCSRLGLIVDLTFTTRYYNPKEFKDNNIDYVKIFFPGRQIPKDAVIKKFFKKVDTFLEENKENDRLIGVHCTHGLNRTGYLICRYMIQRLKISPDQAIADFNSARGHEQEHKFFLEDLKCATWINDADGDDTAEEPETPESYNANNGYGFGYGKRRSNRFDEEDNQEYSRTPKRARNDGYNFGNQDNYDQNEEVDFQWQPKRKSFSNSNKKSRSNPAREIYDRYYGGNTTNQYDPYYYQNNGIGIGPHRPQHRQYNNYQQSSNSNQDRRKPRQYRGPRKYVTPEHKKYGQSYDDNYDQDLQSNSRTPFKSFVKTPKSFDSPLPISPLQGSSYSRDTRQSRYNSRTPAQVDGPSRNPFSPGASEEVFSPENRRRSNRRYNPY